jgi:hypothetical protein
MLSMILSSTAIATASHDVDIPITTDAPEGVAVFFADNMVYAPQWRIGNLVRIETMVLDVSSCLDGDDVLHMDLMPLEVSKSVSKQDDPATEEVDIWIYDQADLQEVPSRLLDTYMVSVPEIDIVITSLVDGVSSTFSGGLEDGAWVGEVTREINQHGHLIYGFLWDTSVDGVTLGAYEVSVKLPVEYDILASVANVYPVVDETTQGDPTHAPPEVEVDPIGFGELQDGDTTGSGGVLDATNEAYVILGPLVEGGSAGTSGDNGDENGGGNDETGNTGNMYGSSNGLRRI